VQNSFDHNKARIYNRKTDLVNNCLTSNGHVYMYKGWAIKLALAPRPLMIYCASTLAAAMIIAVAALPIVLAHGSKPT
jgi:hypothetical protein